MALAVVETITSNIIVDEKIHERVSTSKYLGCEEGVAVQFGGWARGANNSSP
jgi:hypothetical protein